MRSHKSSHVPTWEDFQRLPVMEAYRPRFLSPSQYTEAINLYHLARAAGKQTRYDRMLWASAEISKKYPSISSTAAYKDLSAGLEGY